MSPVERREAALFPRLRPLGDTAVTLELADAASPALAAQVRGLWRRLEQERFPGYREALPTARALLAVYAPGEIGFDEVCARLLALLSRPATSAEPARTHEIPTVYGGEAGPDLAEVAARCGRSQDDVVALHAGREYEALMLGFMPGFAYLGTLAAELRLPRRATPRARVPAGSVAIAADRTAVYPAASPAGWHVIGRTSIALFDPQADPPVLILPGDRVRFVPVHEWHAAPAPSLAPAGPQHPAIEVLDGGLLTTVQDGGRAGLRRLGISASGALDAAALAAANLTIGNDAGAAGLECTLVGPGLRFLATTRFALCGADLSAELQREDLGAWPVPLGTAVLARAGSVLGFGQRRAGLRAYLAFSGGLELPVLLGSRSTDVKAGFGGLLGRPLRAGDRLALGSCTQAARAPEATPVAALDEDDLELRVVPGPQDDQFPEAAREILLSAAYTLGSDSDRFGARLDGPRLVPLGTGEIESDGLLPGCIQVPQDGRPIVVLGEGPTTGGYPKIATIVSADVPRLAQAVPGRTRLRFRAVRVSRD